ncbi:MAG TPA: hypothetical protein VII56_19705 [Rhizomicrobium sp.]
MTWLRSAGALIAGFVAVVVLSIASDIALQGSGIFKGLDSGPLATPFLLAATAHRSLWAVLGSFIAARLAPDRPMAHALILGGVGVVLNIAGMIVMWRLGAHWYPIALTLLALPCAWAGGLLATRRTA